MITELELYACNMTSERSPFARGRFKVGQRVRPSLYGIERSIFPKTRHQQTGVVVKVDEFGDPTILWEGRKTPKGYHASFIAIDRRRKT